jgi:alkylation response protein AidB-like acyl-CoA dehydrogenase
MAMILNEEQQLLKESADGFFAEKAPVSQLRSLRDSADEMGFSSALWSEMAEMGFAGLMIDEDNGGTGFGVAGAGIVAEAMGKNLSASPFLSSAVLAAAVVQSAGTDTQKSELLSAIAAGEQLITLAVDEGAHHAPEKTTLKAEKSGDGYVLSGMKTFVCDGHVADKLIVLARTSGEAGDPKGLSLFVVNKGAAGLIVDRTIMADSRNWAKVTFEGVKVGASDLLGDLGAGYSLLEPALDKARVIVAAELLGVAQECLDRTVTYLQERKQFGVLIGSFQGLQHRAAHLFSEIEVTRSAVLKALQTADTGGDLRWFASLAKAKACKTAELATNESIQMHGGIGMTDEFDIGFYIKRARTLQQFLGDYNYHADRFAACSSY